jgi:hypothetical protein
MASSLKREEEKKTRLPGDAAARDGGVQRNRAEGNCPYEATSGWS